MMETMMNSFKGQNEDYTVRLQKFFSKPQIIARMPYDITVSQQ